MSLLSNEQVENLWETMCEVDNWIEVKSVLKNWNEKQTTQQVAIDWDNAPEKATQAVVNSFWVDANGDTFGVYKTYYYRPAPVITPHPRAEILAKYAEVAQRRIDPWVEFEYRCLSDEWSKCTEFLRFYADYEYRHIGDKK